MSGYTSSSDISRERHSPQPLQNMNEDPDWIACARLYTCECCLTSQRCTSVRVAALPRASSFNQVLDTDVFHILWKEGPRRVLTMMEEHTRFEVDHPSRRRRQGW